MLFNLYIFHRIFPNDGQMSASGQSVQRVARAVPVSYTHLKLPTILRV